MLRTYVISAALLSSLYVPITVHADGYALFSKHEELKAHAVVEAGNVEKFEVRNVSSLSTREYLKLGGRCFEPSGYLGYWGYGKKAGLLMSDRNRSLKLAILESS